MSAAILLTAACAAPAHAQSPAEFFAGKTVTLSIGTGPGGGYDSYGRLVARHWGRHLSATTNVVAQNMPGASSLLLTNHLYNRAPRDGTQAGVINQAMPIEQYMAGGVQYDAARFNWIGRITSATELGIVWHTSPVQKIEDARNHEVIVGGTGPTSSTSFIPWLLNNLAGTRFKVVHGFRGTTEIGLAMERGEVQGSGTPLESLSSYRAEWVRDKKIRVLLQWTAARDAELPEVPALPEMGTTDEGRQILKLFGSACDFGRSVVAPPDIPAARVAHMRRAFDQMLKDEQFLADAAKAKMAVKPATGEQLQTMVAEIATLPAELFKKADAARKEPK